MKKINNKGFTLVEMLAVVVILGVLASIMIPTVTTFIQDNKENNYKDLEQSIVSATKIYISDNRYNITLGGDCESNSQRDIIKIGELNINNSQIPIKNLIESGDLNDGNTNILNPKKDNQKLNINTSYITVKYNCSTKNYDYSSPNLSWN